MKTQSIPFILALAGALASFRAAAQSLVIGTNSIPILFEDSSMAQTNRAICAFDLSEAFEWASSPSVAFDISQDAPLGFGHVREPFDMAMPSDLWDGVCLTNTADGLRCFVSRTLSNAHAARIAQFSGHDIDISELRSRIEAANSPAFDSLPLQTKADFFWHGGTVPENVPPEQEAAFETQIVPMIRRYIVHPPSIFRIEGARNADGDTAALVGWCIFTPRPGVSAKTDAVPVGLVNGQWKFYFGM